MLLKKNLLRQKVVDDKWVLVWKEREHSKWGVTVKENMVSFQSDKNVLNLDHSDGCITL